MNNLISVQPPCSTRSSSVVTLSRQPTISSLKITDRSFRSMHHPVFGINSLIHSVSLANHISIHLLIHLSAHLYYHHHFRHPSLLHSFTPGSKPTFSTNPSHLKTSFTYRTAFMTTGAGLDLLCSSFYFLFHILIFCLFCVVD